MLIPYMHCKDGSRPFGACTLGLPLSVRAVRFMFDLYECVCFAPSDPRTRIPYPTLPLSALFPPTLIAWLNNDGAPIVFSHEKKRQEVRWCSNCWLCFTQLPPTATAQSTTTTAAHPPAAMFRARVAWLYLDALLPDCASCCFTVFVTRAALLVTRDSNVYISGCGESRAPWTTSCTLPSIARWHS
jgi:hypothetical protein